MKKKLVDLSLPPILSSFFPSYWTFTSVSAHISILPSSLSPYIHPFISDNHFPASYSTVFLQHRNRCPERYLRRIHIRVKILHRNSW